MQVSPHTPHDAFCTPPLPSSLSVSRHWGVLHHMRRLGKEYLAPAELYLRSHPAWPPFWLLLCPVPQNSSHLDFCALLWLLVLISKLRLSTHSADASRPLLFPESEYSSCFPKQFFTQPPVGFFSYHVLPLQNISPLSKFWFLICTNSSFSVS